MWCIFLCLLILFAVPSLNAQQYAIQWADTLDNGGTDYAYGIAVDANGNIYVAGRTYNGSDFDDLIIKYDSLGNIIWADTIDNGSTDYIWDVAIDGRENIYITGHSWIGVDYDYFTVKYVYQGGILTRERISLPQTPSLNVSSINRQNIHFSCNLSGNTPYRISLYILPNPSQVGGRFFLGQRNQGVGPEKG